MKSIEKTDQTKVVRGAGAMGLGVMLSRILGLVREQTFAFLFGAGMATDAFNVAFRIPNLMRDLFAEGAMNSALVPTFVQERAQVGDRRAWRVAGLVFRVLLVATTLIALLSLFFSPELISLYASSFKTVDQKFALTVSLTREMLFFFPLVTLAAAFMGILNANGVFFLPAFASALFNLTSVVVGVIASFIVPRFGWHPIEGMAIGVLLGGLVQALVQLPTLYRVGYRWPKKEANDPSWYRDPALRRMLKLMLPAFVGLAATQVNILVITILATSQEQGAVSWLHYAFRLMQFPIGVFGVSMAAATLPVVSKQWVSHQVDDLSETLTESLRKVFAINLPAAAGLAFLGVPIIQLIFEYGAFHEGDTHATAIALACYSLGLVFYSAVKILVPVCYAIGNSFVPVVSSVLSVLLNLVLCYVLVDRYGYQGLAIAVSFTAAFNGVLLIWFIRRKLKRKIKLLSLIQAFLTHLSIALVMGWVCFQTIPLVEMGISDAAWRDYFGPMGVPFARLLRVSILVFEGVALVGLFAYVFRIREIREIFEIIFKKLKSRVR